MGLRDDLIHEVKNTFRLQWQVEDTALVPEPEDLRLNSNHAKNLDTATVLYADLDGSTSMVDRNEWWFAAEVYKTFLRCAGQIIRSETGSITSYDGDRIMAIFTGDSKSTSAVRCALKINYAVEEIIRPALKSQYPNNSFELKHVVGVDSARLHAARIGVKGDNDLVWIGRAANYAAKLTTLSGKPTWITKTVFDSIHESVKFHNGNPMWEQRQWTAMANMNIYCSTYHWSLP